MLVVQITIPYINQHESEAQISFPIPSKHDDTNSNIPHAIQPGIIDEKVDKYIKSSDNALSKSHNVWGDLKKLNTNVASTTGTIDLSGFEKLPTKDQIDPRLID